MERPVRQTFENVTEKVPKGPAGFVGQGNMAGAVTYFAVSLVNGINPIDGVNIGFNVESHSVERKDGKQIHRFLVNSSGKNVARFTSKFNSPPSTADFFLRDIDVKEVNKKEERSTLTTWEVVVELKDRKVINQVEDNMEI